MNVINMVLVRYPTHSQVPFKSDSIHLESKNSKPFSVKINIKSRPGSINHGLLDKSDLLLVL